MLLCQSLLNVVFGVVQLKFNSPLSGLNHSSANCLQDHQHSMCNVLHRHIQILAVVLPPHDVMAPMSPNHCKHFHSVFKSTDPVLNFFMILLCPTHTQETFTCAAVLPWRTLGPCQASHVLSSSMPSYSALHLYKTPAWSCVVCVITKVMNMLSSLKEFTTYLLPLSLPFLPMP